MPTSREPVPRRSWPACVLATAVLLFLVLTWQVVDHGPLTRADRRLSGDLVHPGRISRGLADLGDIFVATPVLLVVLLFVAWRARRSGTRRWWVPSAAAAVVMAAVPLFVVPLKELIARPGPPVMGAATGFYPSGHTATAAVAYGSAALILWPWLRTAHARRTLLLACLAVNAGVAFGLVRHGYHWPLDVVASWCLCAVPLTGLAVFLGRAGGRGRPSPPHGPRPAPHPGRGGAP